VISVPSGLAVEAERALKRFEAAVLAADAPLIGCAGAGAVAEFAGPPFAGPPLVTK
jgi:hypothetical protein